MNADGTAIKKRKDLCRFRSTFANFLVFYCASYVLRGSTSHLSSLLASPICLFPCLPCLPWLSPPLHPTRSPKTWVRLAVSDFPLPAPKPYQERSLCREFG